MIRSTFFINISTELSPQVSAKLGREFNFLKNMEEGRTHFCFLNWWCEYKDMLTPEKWYELEEYIFKFGLDNEYTNPDEIKDMEIRSAWLGISESMLTWDYSYLE